VNSLAKKYYSIGGESKFQEVIFLNEDQGLSFDEISEKALDLPRGWFELSRLDWESRREFISLLWTERLSFHLQIQPAIAQFFSKLEDIDVVIVKKEGEYFPEMVYSLSDNRTFFRGRPFALDEDVKTFRREMNVHFPADYLSFLKLHNGFGKLSEMSVLSMDAVFEAKERVGRILTDPNKPVVWRGQVIHPNSLVPFYEEMGLNSFQCFLLDWYPGSEMGNVYLSGVHYSIQDTLEQNGLEVQKSFESFSKWLTGYLGGNESCI
jgi:hypothetical protein